MVYLFHDVLVESVRVVELVPQRPLQLRRGGPRAQRSPGLDGGRARGGHAEPAGRGDYFTILSL